MTNKITITDYIEINTAPVEERCVQVSKDTPYMVEMRAEAIRYIHILKARFENFDGVSYQIRTNDHEFGTYLDLHLVYNADDMEGREQALFMADNLPMKWTSDEHFRWDIVEAVQYELAVAGVEGY